MSNVQSSSAGAAPPTPDMQSLFSPSDEMPKPMSQFPLANSTMYEAYRATFHERKLKFNSLVSGFEFYYRLAHSENQDGRHDELLEYVVQKVSGARDTFIVDLGEIEAYFRALCKWMGGGDGAQLGN